MQRLLCTCWWAVTAGDWHSGVTGEAHFAPVSGTCVGVGLVVGWVGPPGHSTPAVSILATYVGTPCRALPGVGARFWNSYGMLLMGNWNIVVVDNIEISFFQQDFPPSK